MSPDPDAGSAHSMNPLSWNRYAYVGDPINGTDQTGLDTCDVSNLDGNAIGDPSQMFADCQQEAGAADGGGENFVPDSNPGNTAADPQPTQSVFQNDLGQIGPGSGNSALTYSNAYDLNNGAPGFGGNTTPASAVTSAYQQGCQYTTNPTQCANSASVTAKNVGGTVNVTINNNPMDPNAVVGDDCFLDPLTLFHPNAPDTHYCGGNYFGDTTHVVNVVTQEGVPTGTGVHIDSPGPANPIHWLWSLFAWASDPAQQFTCSAAAGCVPIR